MFSGLAGRSKLIGAVISGALLAVLPFCAAQADSVTYNLGVFNIGGYPAPFGSAEVTLTSATTADIEFTAGSSGGFNYYFIDGGSAAVNVNADSWSISALTAIAAPGFNLAALSDGGAGNEDGWGSFNQTVNSTDGFADASQSISFTLTNLSGTWASAGDVLAANGSGYVLAAHIAVCEVGSCSSDIGALVTGFAANDPGTSVPEPATWSLLIVAFALVGAHMRRRKLAQA